MTETYNPTDARAAQMDYCKRTKSPHFAPTSGTCWTCRSNIYTQLFWQYKDWRKLQVEESEADYSTGVTVEKASSELITGCPHCNKSYVD